jgi:SAM-dependent methyltransferase
MNPYVLVALLVLVTASWFLMNKSFRNVIKNIHVMREDLEQAFLRINESVHAATVAAQAASVPSHVPSAQVLAEIIDHEVMVEPEPPKPAAIPAPRDLLAMADATVNSTTDLFPADGQFQEVLVIDASLPPDVVTARFKGCRTTTVSPEAVPGSGEIAESKMMSLAPQSFDYILCTGSAHHFMPIRDLLEGMRRLLKPGGRATVSVYNYDSIWTHLYHAWCRTRMREERAHHLLDARVWLDRRILGASHDREAFVELADRYGLTAEERGGFLSALELHVLSYRNDAIADHDLEEEHSTFVRSLVTDGRQMAACKGRWAGWKTVYELTRV